MQRRLRLRQLPGWAKLRRATGGGAASCFATRATSLRSCARQRAREAGDPLLSGVCCCRRRPCPAGSGCVTMVCRRHLVNIKCGRASQSPHRGFCSGRLGDKGMSDGNADPVRASRLARPSASRWRAAGSPRGPPRARSKTAHPRSWQRFWGALNTYRARSLRGGAALVQATARPQFVPAGRFRDLPGDASGARGRVFGRDSGHA